ncbi:MAG TPA: HD domain-containing protein [Anaerolineales bacterium]|nr:HD domain-containing protein [Anaerolineales bacterium]HLO32655.1 HD domain-containing protein [Anaerolineales bacterium]
MTPQIFEKAWQYAKSRLERELSPNLLYHGVAHTRDEVVPATQTLARMEGIQGEALLLLLTAAWFHDIGHIEESANHESISSQIAAEVLPAFGFTQDQVEIVRGAILATKLPQSPLGLLEEILADADLDVLGRKNFMQRNRDLRNELMFLGTEFTDEQWYSGQLKFLEGHKYFTASARALMDTQKQLNISILRNKLVGLKMKE